MTDHSRRPDSSVTGSGAIEAIPHGPADAASAGPDGRNASSDDAVLELLAQAFGLAREGHPGLLDVIDRGLPVNLTNHNGDTLLTLAAYYKRTDLVAGLIARGADLDRTNDRGQTALGCAVFRRAERTVDVLLKAGADPDAGGPSARSVAEYFGLTDMAEMLLGGPRSSAARPDPQV